MYLLSQLLDENQGANEDVSVGDVLPHLLKGRGVSKFFQEVAHALHADIFLLLVNAGASGGEGGLVLGLEHHVDDLELLAAVGGGDHAGGREGGREGGRGEREEGCREEKYNIN